MAWRAHHSAWQRSKGRKGHSSFCSQVVEDFGLLRFLPLHVEDKHSMAALLRHVDKANGHAFTGRPDAEALARFSPVATAGELGVAKEPFLSHR